VKFIKKDLLKAFFETRFQKGIDEIARI